MVSPLHLYNDNRALGTSEHSSYKWPSVHPSSYVDTLLTVSRYIQPTRSGRAQLEISVYIEETI